MDTDLKITIRQLTPASFQIRSECGKNFMDLYHIRNISKVELDYDATFSALIWCESSFAKIVELIKEKYKGASVLIVDNFN